MEKHKKSNQLERHNNNINTFVNTMAYDPGDSEFVNSDVEDVENNHRDEVGSGSSSGVESSDNEDLFNESKMLRFPKKSKERRISEISSKVLVQNTRKHGLVDIREQIHAISNQSIINHAQLQTLLSDRNFCLLLFTLFDDKGQGILDQPIWFGKLKYWTKVCNTERKYFFI